MQAKALRSPGEETDSEAAAADAPQGPLLTEDDFANTRRRAVAAVETPAAVLEIISDLRSFLQVWEWGGVPGRREEIAGAPVAPLPLNTLRIQAAGFIC